MLALQITAEDKVDAPIPGENYSFGVLKHAQAIGDWQSLQTHGRRALQIHLKKGAKLAEITAAVQGALHPEGAERRRPVPTVRKQVRPRATKKASGRLAKAKKAVRSIKARAVKKRR